MTPQVHTIELITPCFCAGANQAQAEIRVPSIRGQLRWWFRALGGTPAQEKAIFGGVHKLPGSDKAAASKLVLRVSDIKVAPAWEPFRINPNAPESYVWFYASVSADKTRWTKAGNVPPGTTFKLHVLERLGGMPASERKLFENALEAFLRFGCLGLRATRGLGALYSNELPGALTDYKAAADRILKPAGFTTRWSEKTFPDMRKALAEAGDILKNQLRANYNVKRFPQSPLGNSNPRIASAVHLRPIKCDDGLRLLLFEAPHARVLPPPAQRQQPVLAGVRLA